MLRPAYPLETERLLLRPYTTDDLDALHAIIRRDDVNRYLYSEPRDRDETRDVLARLMTKTAFDDENEEIQLAVAVKGLGAVIGHVMLRRTSREHRQGEVGYIIHPDHHGHGYATEAARVMLRIGFDELGLHRIVGRLDARNARSARVLERLGMRREAHLRENELIKGEWCDELVYAMLGGEWRARPAGEGV
jgi:RimJ/RimL family protein N-acetyltransferase